MDEPRRGCRDVLNLIQFEEEFPLDLGWKRHPKFLGHLGGPDISSFADPFEGAHFERCKISLMFALMPFDLFEFNVPQGLIRMRRELIPRKFGRGEGSTRKVTAGRRK
jgi:hypothetical protein